MEMKRRNLLLALTALALASAGGARAQSDGHHASTPPAPTAPADTAELVRGVVRKVDRGARKVTLRHGPIPNLDMPEMTMVFGVSDPKMLDGLEPSRAVRFRAEQVEGRLMLTHVEPAD